MHACTGIPVLSLVYTTIVHSLHLCVRMRCYCFVFVCIIYGCVGGGRADWFTNKVVILFKQWAEEIEWHDFYVSYTVTIYYLITPKLLNFTSIIIILVKS